MGEALGAPVRSRVGLFKVKKGRNGEIPGAPAGLEQRPLGAPGGEAGGGVDQGLLFLFLN